MHLGIARRLSAHLSDEEIAERVFDLAGQWNRGADQLSDASEIAALIRLNSLAGAKAKSSAAYASARAYYASAVALLPEDAWSAHYDTALDLHLARGCGRNRRNGQSTAGCRPFRIDRPSRHPRRQARGRRAPGAG